MRLTRTSRFFVRFAAIAAATSSLSCRGLNTAVAGPASTTVVSVYVTADQPELYVGRSTTVTARAVTAGGDTVVPWNVVWSSDDSGVATVTDAGRVTARSLGTTSIAARVDTVHGSVIVAVVQAPVDTLIMQPAAAILMPGKVVNLLAVARDVLGNVVPFGPLTWTSSDTSVAAVSSEGVVNAVDTGQAIITASKDSLHASATITVIPYVAGVVVPRQGLGVAAIDFQHPSLGSRELSAVAVDSSGNPVPRATILWTSRNENVAVALTASGQTVDVSGWYPGETELLASSNGFSDSAHVLSGTCDTTRDIAINDFDLPIEAGGQWNGAATAPSGLYRGDSTLTTSGVAFGTDGAHLALGTNITGTWDVGDIAHDTVCSYQTAGVHRSLVDLTLAPSVGLDSLDVVQETWAFPVPAAPTASYVLFRYIFTNERAQPLTNFYAAYLANWGIADSNGFADPLHNVIRYDATLGVGEATGADTVNYPRVFGIVPVAGNGAMNFHGWQSGTGTLGDPATDADIFGAMSGGIDTSVPTAPADIRELMGVGPVTIPAGGRYVVYFGVVGADDYPQFSQAVAAVRARAQSLGF